MIGAIISFILGFACCWALSPMWEDKRRISRCFKKMLAIEIIETLCSICLYLEFEGRRTRNRFAEHMHGHFVELKEASEIMRGVKKPNENQT
jgi:hypothetical protein